MKLLCCTLQYEICQKRLRIWIVTLCNKIIICILLLTLKIKVGHVSTSRRRMATTLGRLDPLVTWPHEVTWLIKNDISSLPRGLWLAKLTRWRFIVKGHHPFSLLLDHMSKLSRGRWKTLYLNFRGTYGYQTWQSGGFYYLRGPIIYQVT